WPPKVLPVNELVFLKDLPRRIDTLSGLERGDALPTVVASVSGADLIIDSSVSQADRPLLSEGMIVNIVEEGLGIDVDGVISFVANKTGTDGAASDRYAMRIVPRGDLSEQRNSNVRISIPVQSTDGEVLTVPHAALSAGSDGSARIEVERADGTTELVSVKVGLSAGGAVEVSPLDSELEPGDQVVVGKSVSPPDDSGSP
ncbi:MAG: hypothetical protein ACC652_15315, partial [Acidimicrobiales bacterium]